MKRMKCKLFDTHRKCNNEVKKKLIIIFLIVLIFSVFTVAREKEEYSNIVLVKCINLSASENKIEFTIMEPTKDCKWSPTRTQSFNFPYNADRYGEKFRNLIENKDKDLWIFLEYTDTKDKWFCTKIIYSEADRMLRFYQIFDDKSFSPEKNMQSDHFADDETIRIMNADSRGERVITNYGALLNINSLTYSLIYTDTYKDNLLFPVGADFINDNEIVTQTCIPDDLSNILHFINIQNHKCLGFIKAGYMIHHRFDNYLYPIDSSLDGKKIVFLSRQIKPEIMIYPQKLTLYVYDMEKQELIKIIDLPEKTSITQLRSKYDSFLKWSPQNNSSLAALYNNGSLMIIDVVKKSILKDTKIDFEIKNLRWSPDLKKIALLSWEGQLYIYDPVKDSLNKIVEDKECFDFFWSNPRKNPFDRALDKVRSFLKQ